jgi:type II secretory ATPase GspE/PulE/Tfp pilus assembly ATPase PilB-like protein
MMRRNEGLEQQIGALLVEGGFLSQEQLGEAMNTARLEDRALREVLDERGIVNPETYTTFLSMETRVPITDLQQVQIEQAAIDAVPEEVARQYGVLPISLEGGTALRVAMENPQDTEAINALAAVTGLRIKPRIPVRSGIDQMLDRFYHATPRIASGLREILGEAEPLNDDLALEDAPQEVSRLSLRTMESPLGVSRTEESPVVRALEMIILQAIRDRASDIHFDPTETSVRIRYRVDGVLHEAAVLPRGVQGALVSRIKVLAGMDIAERRRPQDGSFTMNLSDRAIDFRVASIETAHGELMVLRVLDKSTSVLTLQDMGMQPSSAQTFSAMLRSPYGMVMVSGPTGSGKTTTLYAAVNQLDTVGMNVMTVEDPIEYQFQGVNQIQVNNQVGISFASGLRSIVRLDPDVILVGEIRDQETANTAVQAALTGHLVLTSIHANDSAAAIIRLIDLGVEPFLVTSAVIGSVAQRLVRRICQYCKTIAGVDPAEAAAYQQEMGEVRTDFYIGRGCNMCSRTGFQGRTGVYELLVMNDGIRTLINQSSSSDQIKAEAVRSGMVTLRRDGMLKAKDGITTPREIIRSVFTVT